MFQANLNQLVKGNFVADLEGTVNPQLQFNSAFDHVVFTNSKFYRADSHIVAANEIFSRVA